MYTIDNTDFGLRIEFGGIISRAEMDRWFADMLTALDKVTTETFGILVDMRQLETLPVESQESLKLGQKVCLERGMVRSCVIVDSRLTYLQFVRIARRTGILQGERYIDAKDVPHWEKVGLDWVVNGKEPAEQVLNSSSDKIKIRE